MYLAGVYMDEPSFNDPLWDRIDFLVQHDIPISRVMNANGVSVRSLRSFMSAHGIWLAFNVTPCQAAGHTLRTRAGHCAQCNPASIAFLRRHDEAGEVYIAYSRRLRLVKIGTAKNHEARCKSLNDDCYGGTSDWSMRWYLSSNRAGRVEARAQHHLRTKGVTRAYVRFQLNELVRTSELFRCSLREAFEAVQSAAGHL